MQQARQGLKSVDIPGVSENITVRSLVGTFLEHSRIFYFENEGHPELYMGSADWMPRNLDKRVEIVFPVEDQDIQKEIMHILQIQLSDTLKARVMTKDGSYRRVDRRGKVLLGAQKYFCEEAVRAAEAKKSDPVKSRVFTPAQPQRENGSDPGTD